MGFTKACDEHDSLYTEGGDVGKRFSADSTFFERMKERVAAEPSPWRKVGIGIVAPINHLLVRLGGWASFRYRGK